MLEEDKKGILLESGTNEIEVMEFTIDGSLYGINVAKVKEILVSAPVKPMPHAHAAVAEDDGPSQGLCHVLDEHVVLAGEEAAVEERHDGNACCTSCVSQNIQGRRMHRIPRSTVSNDDDDYQAPSGKSEHRPKPRRSPQWDLHSTKKASRLESGEHHSSRVCLCRR